MQFAWRFFAAWRRRAAAPRGERDGDDVRYARPVARRRRSIEIARPEVALVDPLGRPLGAERNTFAAAVENARLEMLDAWSQELRRQASASSFRGWSRVWVVSELWKSLPESLPYWVLGEDEAGIRIHFLAPVAMCCLLEAGRVLAQLLPILCPSPKASCSPFCRAHEDCQEHRELARACVVRDPPRCVTSHP